MHKDFVRGAQFLVTCFEEIVMATNNSGLDWNYLLVSEKRREREEEKGIEEELTGALAKRIQVENLCSICDLFTDS